MGAKTKFILDDFSPAFLRKFEKAEDRAVAQVVKMIEATAKKNSPVRTKGTPAEKKRFGSGTNQRGIVSESKGKNGSVRGTSGYSWWLEILKRTYGIGRRGYMKIGYDEHKKKTPSLIRKAFNRGV